MKKIIKKTKKKVSVPVEEVLETPAIVELEVKIFPFSGDFGRQDINSLRDKVNEIIDFINK